MEQSNGKTTVEVVINGEIVTLTGVESEEYIQKLARYIDRKILEIQREKKILSFNTFLKTLIVAINIADDLHKEMDENAKLSKEYEKALSELGKLQEENFLVNEKIREMQTELTNIRLELDGHEYISDNKKKIIAQSNKVSGLSSSNLNSNNQNNGNRISYNKNISNQSSGSHSNNNQSNSSVYKVKNDIEN